MVRQPPGVTVGATVVTGVRPTVDDDSWCEADLGDFHAAAKGRGPGRCRSG